MSYGWALLCSFLTLVLIMGTSMLMISLQYSVFWHRFRKHKYRIIQRTIISRYTDEPKTQYIIQKKKLWGWEDNPEIPMYDWYGKLSLFRTESKDTLEEAQEYMDSITAVLRNEGKKDNIVG